MEESLNLKVELDGMWAEYDTLGNVKPQATGEAALVLEIKDVLPSILHNYRSLNAPR